MNEKELQCFMTVGRMNVAKDYLENVYFWENEDEELPRPETVTVVQDELADDPDLVPIHISDPLVDPLSMEHRIEIPPEPINQDLEDGRKVFVKIEHSDSDDSEACEHVPEDDGYRSGSDENTKSKNKAGGCHLSGVTSTRNEESANKVQEKLLEMENASVETRVSAKEVTPEIETRSEINGALEIPTSVGARADACCPEIASSNPCAISGRVNAPEVEVTLRLKDRASMQSVKFQLGADANGPRATSCLENRNSNEVVDCVARQTRNERASKEWAKVHMIAAHNWPKGTSPKKSAPGGAKLLSSSITKRTLHVALTRCEEAERLVSATALAGKCFNRKEKNFAPDKGGENEMDPMEDFRIDSAVKIPRLKIRKIRGTSGWEMASIDEFLNKSSKSVKGGLETSLEPKKDSSYIMNIRKIPSNTGILSTLSAQDVENDLLPENKFNTETSVSREKTPDGKEGGVFFEGRDEVVPSSGEKAPETPSHAGCGVAVGLAVGLAAGGRSPQLEKLQIVERPITAAGKSPLADGNQGAEFKPWSCFICHKGFVNRFAMSSHTGHCKRRLQQYENRNLPYECGKILSSKARLSSQTVSHGQTRLHSQVVERTYECKECMKLFATMKALNVHKTKMGHRSEFLKNKTLLKPLTQNKSNDSDLLPCEICHLVFSTSACLEEHRVVHAVQFDDIRNLKNANILSVSKGVQKNLVHDSQIPAFSQQSRKDVQNVECNEKSVSDFSQMLLSKSSNMYFCNRCGFRFSNSSKLMVHARVCENQTQFVNSFKELSHSSTASKGLMHRKDVCSNKGLQDHLDGKSKPYRCKACPISFYSHSRYRKHLKRHTGVKPYKCGICGNTYGNSWSLKRHKSLHERNYKCGFCGLSFRVHQQLKDHKCSKKPLVVSNMSKNVLQSCGKDLVEVTSNISATQHVSKKQFSCRVCEKTFSTLLGLKIHMHLHGGNPLQCNVCDKKLSTPGRLRDHIRSFHTLETPYQCNLCDKAYSSSSTLRLHRKYKHKLKGPTFLKSHFSAAVDKYGIKPGQHAQKGKKENKKLKSKYEPSGKKHKCDICSRNFSTQGYLLRHTRRFHLKKKMKESVGEYNLETCETSFDFHSSLQKHSQFRSENIKDTIAVKSHSLEEPDPSCTQNGKDCIEKTANSSTAQYINKKEYFCGICEMIFVTPGDLKIHMHLHEENPLQCNFCGRISSTSTRLKEHIRALHTFERPYQCNLCDKAYSGPDSLRVHRQSKHKSNSSTFPKKKKKDSVGKQKCDMCNASFFDAISLGQHKLRFHPEKSDRYECNQCNTSYEFSSTFLRHMHHFHPEKAKHLSRSYSQPRERIYKCNQCDAKFNLRSTWLKHTSCFHLETRIKASTVKTCSSKMYKCNLCEAKYAWKHNLQRHIRAIHKENQKENREISEIESQSISSFQTHSSEKCECDLCGAKFAWKDNLVRHKCEVHKENQKENREMSHSSEKIHKCNECNVTFDLPATLLRHLHYHHKKKDKETSALNSCSEEQLYNCDLCNEVFDHRSTLLEHKANFHKEKSKEKSTTDFQRYRNYKCNMCSAKYSSRQSLLRHKRDCYIEEESFQCTVCHKLFSSAVMLIKHHENHFKKLDYS